MKFNRLFEELNSTEQKAVKFNFENIASFNDTYFRGGLVKLIANGTTGYPVYYLYTVYKPENQSYVLRIIKQGRKCKLVSFGNPKLIWTFLGETEAKIPKRDNATLDAFTRLFRMNSISGNKIITWINNKIGSNITLKDFNVNASERELSGVIKGNTSTTTNTNDKVSVIQKLIKNFISNKKSQKQQAIEINIVDFYYDNEKVLSKFYPDDDVDKLMEDIYKYGIYKIDLPGYTRTENICRPSIWLSNSYNTYIDIIKYLAKPCKEFDSLNKYLVNTLKCKPLQLTTVSSEGVSGKRSRIFDRFGLRCLAYEANLCKYYKQQLQTAKKPTWNASIEFKNELDDGDRYNGRGEDMESEWDGKEINYAIVTFKTPGGKTMKQIKLYP